MTQISADGYTVRGHYGTVFLPLGVTKGTIKKIMAASLTSNYRQVVLRGHFEDRRIDGSWVGQLEHY
jgi:hypothetical protein